MKRKLINTIKIDAANLEFIAKTGKINGTLLIEIERVMTEYARQQVNGLERSSDKCHIQNVSKNEAVIFCENEFSTCIYQSFDKCTLKEKCPSQKMKAK